MVRKYGGLTGDKKNPTTGGAPGSWIAPSEAYRERTANSWPVSVPAADLACPLGSVILASTSGVVDDILATTGGSFVIASGGFLSTSTYPTLFGIFGTTFGGDGINNFGFPNLFDKYVYFKGETTSGTSPLYGSGNLPDHTHTAYRRNFPGSSQGNTTTSNTRAEMVTSTTNVDTSYDTDTINSTGANNEMNKRELIPLITCVDARLPVGCAFPVLWPGASGVYPSYDSGRFTIASGQQLRRADYPKLFNLLGVHYGSGDGSTTFNIPDYRGIVLSSSRQPASVLQPSGVISPSGFLPSTFARHAHVYSSNYSQQRNGDFGGSQYILPYRSITPATTEYTGAGENRAANISVIYFLCIS